MAVPRRGPEGGRRGVGKPWGGVAPAGSARPIEKLHEAEKTFGIEQRKGRAYHGVKRAHVTVSWDEAGGDAAAVGDLTGNRSPGVLARHYRCGRSARKVARVDRVRARFAGEAIPGRHTTKAASA